jgi:hypothetical protein
MQQAGCGKNIVQPILKKNKKHFLMIYYEDFFRLSSFRVIYLQYLLYEEGNTVSFIY